MNEEVVNQTSENNVTVSPESNQTSVTSNQEPTSNQAWKAMRQRAEAAERRAQELEQMAVQSASGAVETDDDDFNLGIEDESLAEGKHVKKAYKSLKKELKETKKQLEHFNSMSAEMRLRSKFTDFDKVITEENMQRLAAQKPSLARSIAANPDLYDKGETAYDAIKSWIMTETFPETEKRIEENKQKPKSAGSSPAQAADTPLVRIEDYDRRVLTPERKQEIMRQVQQYKQFRT